MIEVIAHSLITIIALGFFYFFTRSEERALEIKEKLKLSKPVKTAMFSPSREREEAIQELNSERGKLIWKIKKKFSRSTQEKTQSLDS